MASVQCPLSLACTGGITLGAATESSGTHSQKQTIGRVVDPFAGTSLGSFGRRANWRYFYHAGKTKPTRCCGGCVLYERFARMDQAGGAIRRQAEY